MPRWTELGSHSALMKSFGGIAAAIAISAGVYFYGKAGREVTPPSDVTIDAPKPKSVIFDWNITPAQIPDKEVMPLETVPKAMKADQKVEKFVTEEIPMEEKQGFVPSFEAPNAATIREEETLQISSLDELPGEKLSESTRNPIDITTEITRNLNIKYKYYDGKLFLSGDFDRAPYEILEINSSSGRRIYVKYLNKYYMVETTYRLSFLPEVTNREVIEELKLLRGNK